MSRPAAVVLAAFVAVAYAAGARRFSAPSLALATINRTIDQQAYTMAVTDLFYLSSLLFLLLIGVVWLTKPRIGVAAGGGGAH